MAGHVGVCERVEWLGECGTKKFPRDDDGDKRKSMGRTIARAALMAH